ncbi:MAG: hypothetical protein WBE58_23535 [Verrucomicrobiales bacterium]
METITTPTTVETYIKERGGKRVNEQSKTAFVTQLDAVADRVARAALAAMTTAGEKTLFPEHVAAGVRILAADGPASPESVFAAMERLSNDDLALFLRLIQDWLANPPPPR